MFTEHHRAPAGVPNLKGKNSSRAFGKKNVPWPEEGIALTPQVGQVVGYILLYLLVVQLLHKNIYL